IGSLLLSWYFANFGTYNATYGSLGAVIGFIIWMWLSTIIVLLGAEINAEMEHQTAKDTAEGPANLSAGGAPQWPVKSVKDGASYGTRALTANLARLITPANIEIMTLVSRLGQSYK